MNGPIVSSQDSFKKGLVFGFDVGTGSIGYAVRKGAEFIDVGVLICPEDTNKLDKRRSSRSQRRRLRNRTRVRSWLARQLEEKFSLPSPWLKSDEGQIILKPGLDFARISNPVLLRCEALEGRLEKPEELHAAIVHASLQSLGRGAIPNASFRPRWITFNIHNTLYATLA